MSEINLQTQIDSLQKKIEKLPISKERNNLIKQKVVLEWIRDGLPTVSCPKEGKKVPVWFCTGSFVQQREMCPNLIEITVRPAGNSKVTCKLPKKRR